MEDSKRKERIDLEDSVKEQFLFEAVGRMSLDGVKKMLAHRPNLNSQNYRNTNSQSFRGTALHTAATCAKDKEKVAVKIVKLLLAAGANVNAKDNFNDQTPLHVACERGRTSIAKVLLAAGADVNVRDCWGKTPLHFAAIAGCKELVVKLIAKGADINAKDERQWTPLTYIEGVKGNSVTAWLLRAKGANAGALDRRGEPGSRSR